MVELVDSLVVSVVDLVLAMAVSSVEVMEWTAEWEPESEVVSAAESVEDSAAESVVESEAESVVEWEVEWAAEWAAVNTVEAWLPVVSVVVSVADLVWAAKVDKVDKLVDSVAVLAEDLEVSLDKEAVAAKEVLLEWEVCYHESFICAI